MSDAPFRRNFDAALDPRTARNAIGAASQADLVADFALAALKADFPATAWTTYSPTVSSSGGTITSYTVNSAKWKQYGKLVLVSFDVTITNQGTGTGDLRITLPVNATNTGGIVVAREVAAVGVASAGQIFSATNLSFSTYNNTSAVITNYQWIGGAAYEAA